jgi:hypothetical protein
MFAVEILFLFISFFSLISIIYYTFKNGIGPTITTKKVRKKLLEECPKIEGSIAILGSGFGILAKDIATKYWSCTIYAYENSIIPFFVSKLMFSRIKNLKFIKTDFYSIDLGVYKLLICYLYPEAMKKLKNKLLSEVDKPIEIITHTFKFNEITENKKIYCNDIYKTPVYFYKFERKDVL